MQSNRVFLSILGWVIGFIIFFPILWMVMASLKTEIEAVATPPSFFFVPTLENYFVVQSRSDYLNYARNSIVISVFATLLAILIAVLPTDQKNTVQARLDSFDQDDATRWSADPNVLAL